MERPINKRVPRSIRTTKDNILQNLLGVPNLLLILNERIYAEEIIPTIKENVPISSS